MSNQDLKVVDSKTCEEARAQAVNGTLHRLRFACEEGRSVLLLVAAGSASDVAVDALNQMTDQELSCITIAQLHENFSDGDSSMAVWDSFIAKVKGADKLARVMPILKYGSTLSEVVNNYDLELTVRIKRAAYSLAVMGIGEDGTIAGMHPSDSMEFQQHFFGDDFVVGYEDKRGNQIVTITDYCFRVIQDIVVFSCGANKLYTIELLNSHTPVNEHPVQLLRSYDRVTLYTSNSKI